MSNHQFAEERSARVNPTRMSVCFRVPMRHAVHWSREHIQAIEKMRAALVFYCRTRYPRAEAARVEDVVQDALLALLVAAPSHVVLSPCTMFAWLRTTVIRLLIRDHGRDLRERAMPSDGTFEESTDRKAGIQNVTGLDAGVDVGLLLALLSQTSRNILLMYADGFSADEIASVLGIGSAAVRKRLSRARAMLRRASE